MSVDGSSPRMLLGEGLHFDALISASLALLPPEEFEEPRAGRVALGGYVVFPEAPEWRSEEIPSGTVE